MVKKNSQFQCFVSLKIRIVAEVSRKGSKTCPLSPTSLLQTEKSRLRPSVERWLLPSTAQKVRPVVGLFGFQRHGPPVPAHGAGWGGNNVPVCLLTTPEQFAGAVFDRRPYSHHKDNLKQQQQQGHTTNTTALVSLGTLGVHRAGKWAIWASAIIRGGTALTRGRAACPPSGCCSSLDVAELAPA